MSLRAILIPLGFIPVLVLPPFAYERIAQHFYLLYSPTFFWYSGTRYYVDVGWMAGLGGLAGYAIGGVRRAWLVCAASVALLMALVFAACEPRLCYSTGVDGLEPLRMGSFLLSVAAGTAYIGSWAKSRRDPGLADWAVSACAAFFAIAYTPMVFTLAGAGILYPYSPWSVLVLLAVTAMVLLAKRPEGAGRGSSAVPVAAVLLLLAVCAGVATHYIAQAVPFMGAAVLSATVGAAAASALPRARRVFAALRRSPVPLALVVVFVFTTSLIVWPDAVAGFILTSSNPAGPSSTYAVSTTYYAGGFLSSPMIRPHGVAANVSFGPGDAAALGPGGFLAAGINVHSADCCTDGIDYGYRFDALLWKNGSLSLDGTAWKVCDANGACAGHSWKVLLFHRSLLLAGHGAPLRLALQWVNRSVLWTYDSGGGAATFASVPGGPQQNAAFNAGWMGPPDTPSPGGAFFFQFGVAATSLPSAGWTATISCPAVLTNGTWACIDHAESLQGDQSYWKVLWRWGEAFPGVAAAPDPDAKSVTFSGSSATMGSFATFW